MVKTGRRLAMAFTDLHFKYINPIRRKDGTLREWDEYNNLTMLEASLDTSACIYTRGEERRRQDWKHKLIEKEQCQKK